MLATPRPSDQECGPLVERGRRLAEIGRRGAALVLAERAAALHPTSAARKVSLGQLFIECDAACHALPQFESATRTEPENLEYRYYLAVTQRLTGDALGAEENLDRVLLGRPDFYGAYLTRADLRTQTAERNHVRELSRLLAQPLRARGDEVLLCFAIAKELEDLGRFDQSFEYLQRGCGTYRRSLTYDVDDEIRLIGSLISTHTSRALQRAPPGFDCDECNFIFGLPRTGTTLVERILSAHPQVHGAGELPTFPQQLATRLPPAAIGSTSPRALAEEFLRVNPRDLGAAYVQAARPRTCGVPRFTDKLPLNYLYAAVIHRALPRARLVVTLRDPMDACYAMYKTLFTGAYRFSYDLRELGRYFIAWNALITHWQDVLGDALLVVKYERLIADQQRVTREILSHCGLPWDDRCMAFHEQPSAVSSASAIQVRRPLYSSSVGKWRNYARQLEPLLDTLEQRGLQLENPCPDRVACTS